MNVRKLMYTTISMISTIAVVFFAAQSITVDTVDDYIEGNAVIIPSIYTSTTILWLYIFLLFVVFIIINIVAFRNMKALLIALLSCFLTWIITSVYSAISIFTYLKISMDVMYVAYLPAIHVMFILKDPQMYLLIFSIVLMVTVFVLNIAVDVDE